MTRVEVVGTWGGKRNGAGRKLNPLKSAKIAADLIERNKAMKGDANTPTPLEFLLAELWNPELPADVRRFAAVQCLPFIHPKLQSVNVQHEDDHRLVIELVDFNRSVVTLPAQPAITVIADDDDD